jgi:sulfite exporter TauE/SafE
VTVPSALTQLLALGWLWVFFHCAGMCGPIVGGLSLGGAGRLGLYQVGRAITLSTLGAMAGAFGSGVAGAHTRGGAWLAAIGALALAAWALRAKPQRRATVSIGAASPLGRLWQRVVRGLFALGTLRPLALGVMLGFLPCMIVAWALSLAASAASPTWGAVIMTTLVAMTTPMLALATAVSGLLSRSGWGIKLQRTLLLVSALWLALVAAAGFGAIEHAHAQLSIWGRSFSVMFY